MKRPVSRLASSVVILFIFMFCTVDASGWGREGHEVIAKIAENNLNTRSRKIIEKYLDNHSIVYYAKWMDDYRHTSQYSFTNYWHTVLVDEQFSCVPREGGDALHALEAAIEILENYKECSDSTVSVNLKYVIHLVADMHCPSHIHYKGRPKDFTVSFGGGYLGPVVQSSMHAIWDKLAIQSCRIWSVSDYAEQLDRLSRKEMKSISDGTPQEWLRDNAARCSVQFEMASEGSILQQDFINEAMPLIETQMLYAGYRLSSILNHLF